MSTGGRLTQAPPDVHVFSGRWLARHLVSGLAEITVTVRTEQGPVAYRIDRFGDGEQRPDMHAWHGTRVDTQEE